MELPSSHTETPMHSASIIVEVVEVFVCTKKKIFTFTTIVGLLCIAYYFFIATLIFKATATILPKMEEKNFLNSLVSNLSDVGSTLGLQGKEVEIYPNIIKSRRMIEPVLFRKFQTNTFKDSVLLIEFLNFKKDKGDTAYTEETIQDAIALMQKNIIEVTIDKKTSLLSLDVSMPHDANVAAEVANILAENFGKYNRYVKRTQATEQLSYVEKRLREVEQDLQQSEITLKEFREQNRRTMDSPVLLMEENLLSRAMELNQAVFVELRKQLELIKLEVMKTSPIINILDYAVPHAKKDKPKRLINSLGITLFTFLLSLSYQFLLFKARKNREKILMVVNTTQSSLLKKIFSGL